MSSHHYYKDDSLDKNDWAFFIFLNISLLLVKFDEIEGGFLPHIYRVYSERCRPVMFDRIGKTETSASLGKNNRANYMAAVQVNPNI